MDKWGWLSGTRALWQNGFVKGIDARPLHVLLILLLSLLPFMWAAPGIVVNQFDYNFSFDPQVSWDHAFQLWGSYDSLGSLHPRDLAGVSPNYAYYLLADSIGIPLWLSQRIMFSLILFCAGMSMYALFRTWDFGPKVKDGAIFAAVTYMFSPVAAMFTWNQFTTNYYSFMFLPLILALVIHGIRTSAGPRFAYLTALVWTLLIASAYMNPVRAGLDLLLVVVIALTFIFLERRRLRDVVRYAVPLFAIWMVLNLFWALPQYSVLMQPGGSAEVGGIGISNQELLDSNTVPMSNGFLQTGYWALYGEYRGDNWYSWNELAQSPAYILSLGIISALAFASLLIGPKRRGLGVLAGISLLCIFMINGSRPPFGWVFDMITDRGELVMAFRSMYQLFGPILTLCMAIMLGCSAGYIWNGIRPIRPLKFDRTKIIAYSITALIISSIAIVGLPYLTGDIINRGGNVVPSARVVVPEYYQETADWFSSVEGDYRVLGLPFNKLGYAAYSWESGIWAQDPSTTLLPVTVLSNANERERDVLVQLADAFAQGRAGFDTQKVLSLLNVRFVLLHGDADWEFIQGHSWWASPNASFADYEMGLLALGYVQVAELGSLVLFENPSWVEMHYYDTDDLIAICGGWEGVRRLTSEAWYSPSNFGLLTTKDESAASDQIDSLIDAWYFSSDDPRSVAVQSIGGMLVKMPEQLVSVDSKDGWVRYSMIDQLSEGRLSVFVNGHILGDTTFQLEVDDRIVIESNVSADAWTEQNLVLLGDFISNSSWSNVVLKQKGGEQMPSSFLIVPSSQIDLGRYQGKGIHYTLGPLSQFLVAKEGGSRQLVSTNGTQDPSLIVYDTIGQCPYGSILDISGEYWAKSCTLVYMQAGGMDIGIDSITADGHSVPGIVMLSEDGMATEFQSTSIHFGEKAVLVLPGISYRYVTLCTDEGKVNLLTGEWGSEEIGEWYERLYGEEIYGQLLIPEKERFLVEVRTTIPVDSANISMELNGTAFQFVDPHLDEEGLYYQQWFDMEGGMMNISLISTAVGNASLASIVHAGLRVTLDDEAMLEMLISNESRSKLDFSFDKDTHRNSNGMGNASILIFMENYDLGWTCGVDAAHFRVNWLGNGFLIDTSRSNLVLHYQPQDQVESSLNVSISAIVLLGGITLLWPIMRRRT